MYCMSYKKNTFVKYMFINYHLAVNLSLYSFNFFKFEYLAYNLKCFLHSCNMCIVGNKLVSVNRMSLCNLLLRINVSPVSLKETTAAVPKYLFFLSKSFSVYNCFIFGQFSSFVLQLCFLVKKCASRKLLEII